MVSYIFYFKWGIIQPLFIEPHCIVISVIVEVHVKDHYRVHDGLDWNKFLFKI